MRISNWAKELKLHVKTCEERPDESAGDVVYRVKDLFTTRNGKWDPSNDPGSVPQWARDAYLRSPQDDDYFDDAGADHHIFARVLDLEGKPLKTQDLIICWSDGFRLLDNPNFKQWIKMKITPKQKSGWGNQPIWNTYYPDQDQVGAWCWCPRGAADVVVGGGLPYNWHVSTFAVWQAEKRNGNGNGNGELDLDAVHQKICQLISLDFQRESAFANYARDHNLGAPLTEEIQVGGYSAQGFAGGIVYAPVANPSGVGHMAW